MELLSGHEKIITKSGISLNVGTLNWGFTVCRQTDPSTMLAPFSTTQCHNPKDHNLQSSTVTTTVRTSNFIILSKYTTNISTKTLADKLIGCEI
jgi:hypothetical protein